MYAACGAVSVADHVKLQADLDAAIEDAQDTKDALKKEKASRKAAEKKVEQTEVQVEERKHEKEKLEVERKHLVKDTEKKSGDLEKAKSQVDKLRSDLEQERQAAEEARKELAEAKELAEQVQSELAKKAAEAEQLAADSARVKAEAEAKIREEEEKIHSLEKEIAKEELKHGPVWSSGLCCCCETPGGIGLCLKAFCCPCLILGRMNASLKLDGSNPCPGGCCGGCCLGCCCVPCYMRSAAPAVARKSGKEEGNCKACCHGLCCPCCYMTQVYRETLLIAETQNERGIPVEAPLQESMEMGGRASDKPKPEKSAHKWSTGLCSCCAQPGGCELCCKTACCPCLVTKSLNNYLKSQESDACYPKCGGCGGCCFACCCLPCFMRKAGPAVAEAAGHRESRCIACIKGCCCLCCYLDQVYRESLILSVV